MLAELLHPLSQIPLPPQNPSDGPMSSLRQGADLRGLWGPKHVGRLAGSAPLAPPTSLGPLPLITPPMGRFGRFCRPETPLGALNCRQIGTRPLTIERRGSMDRIGGTHYTYIVYNVHNYGHNGGESVPDLLVLIRALIKVPQKR